MKSLLAAPLLAVSVLLAAPTDTDPTPIKLIGPAALEVRETATYQVQGLSEDQLRQASVSASPAEGVTLIPARSWGGEPFLIFASRNEGEHIVTVALNEWRTAIDKAAEVAASSPMSDELKAEFADLAARIEAAYPSFHGSLAIQVGEGDPPPPVPVENWHALIIEETGQRQPPWGDVFLTLRTDDDLGAELYIVDKDGQTAGGNRIENVEKYLEAVDGELPYLFVIEEIPDGGKVRWKGTCPQSADDIKAVLKKFQ